MGACEDVPDNLSYLLFFSGRGRDLLSLGVTQDLENVAEKEPSCLPPSHKGIHQGCGPHDYGELEASLEPSVPSV